MSDNKVLYKVYCGKNGKTYTYLSQTKAEQLFNSLVEQNYRSNIIKIENKKQILINEFN